MQRGREKTEQRLLEAVGQIITNDGLDQVRINRVASRAGVNKILIYRYFGGLSGLIETYYSINKPVVSAPAIDVERLKDAPLTDFFEACYGFMIDEFRLLRNNVHAQQFIKANLLSNNCLHNTLAGEKEKKLQAMVDDLAKIIELDNGRPFAAILMSGMTMLTLMAQQKRTILGIDLASEEGWQQIEVSLGRLFHGAYLYTKERLEADSAEKSV
ncbi:TetR/AcrR family transcriptional regulator [Spirosoma montaniterrae]|uniref:HTH tetR-type domain-containing protein n=1 Tax=Spirosoma montaniterrae TaxID=1178516 RepID=A0A1P9WTN3_9BACT|nr:TetR/AcrR family transcriptional regulator [Spirosoma montaniterrae]AQG78739.1 hypothetical protein AWR27_04980 [Spirosoma montaniterrae]